MRLLAGKFTLVMLSLLTAIPPAIAKNISNNSNEEFKDDDDLDDATNSAGNNLPTQKVQNRQKTTSNQSKENMPVASSRHVRRFHAVLDELLSEFGYDVKSGQIKGLSNISVRKVKVSSAIPRTYEEYLETLIVERIRENSQVRVIDCIPCKTRTSSLVDGKLMITSPATNLAKLESAATTLSIENFMDVILVYHTSHMVLAINIFNTQTKEMLWARSYNSETVKTRFQKSAIDLKQLEPQRLTEEYVPEYRLMIGLGGANIPNISGKAADSAMLNLQVRSTEKFNNRHNEVGMMLSILQTVSSLISPQISQSTDISNSPGSSSATAAQAKSFNTAVGIYAFFSHIFLGKVESYDEVRTGINASLGAIIAAKYLAPAFRGGVDFYMGRRFSLSLGVDYIGAASINVNGSATKAQGGMGADLIFSANY